MTSACQPGSRPAPERSGRAPWPSKARCSCAAVRRTRQALEVGCCCQTAGPCAFGGGGMAMHILVLVFDAGAGPAVRRAMRRPGAGRCWEGPALSRRHPSCLWPRISTPGSAHLTQSSSRVFLAMSLDTLEVPLCMYTAIGLSPCADARMLHAAVHIEPSSSGEIIQVGKSTTPA